MNKDIIEKAIKEAREKGRGKIISRDDIYNAILQAGIKQVVEFIGEHPFEHNTTGVYPYNHLDDCFACRYETKLKDWGI